MIHANQWQTCSVTNVENKHKRKTTASRRQQSSLQAVQWQRTCVSSSSADDREHRSDEKIQHARVRSIAAADFPLLSATLCIILSSGRHQSSSSKHGIAHLLLDHAPECDHAGAPSINVLLVGSTWHLSSV